MKLSRRNFQLTSLVVLVENAAAVGLLHAPVRCVPERKIIVICAVFDSIYILLRQ